MKRFFLWLGGAEPEVLEQAPSTGRVTAALGGTVLTTSLMAAVAFTMATHDWLHVSWGVAAVVGCGWGLAIMNLDRWLLMATRRQKTTLRTIALAIPRVLLAVVIACVIAEPLVLRVFENEVTLQAKQDRQDEKTAREKDLEKQFRDIPKLETRQTKLQQAITTGPRVVFSGNADYEAAKAANDKAQEKLAKAERSVGCEAEGTCGTGRSGCGPVCTANRRVAGQRQRAAQQAERELSAVTNQLRQTSTEASRQSRAFATPELARVNKKLGERRAARDKELAVIGRDYTVPMGAIDRIEALHHLGDESAAVAWGTWLFRLFLIAVDLTPILFKTLLLVGEKSQAELVKEDQEKSERERNAMTQEAENKAHRITVELIEKEAAIQAGLLEPALQEVNEEVAEVQREIWRKQLEDWRNAVSSSGGMAVPTNGVGPTPAGAGGASVPPPTAAHAGAGSTSPTGSGGGAYPGGSGGGMVPASAQPGRRATGGGLVARARARLAALGSTLRRPATRTAGP